MSERLMEEYINDAMIRIHNDLPEGSSISDIEEFLSQYDESQIQGVMGNVKGYTAEEIAVDNENNDGDDIQAKLNENPSQEASDMELTNEATGEIWEGQIKATDSNSYIQNTMDEHPDIEVYATEEVANEMGIEDIGISNEELEYEIEKYFVERGVLDESELSDFEPEFMNQDVSDGIEIPEWALDIEDVLNIGLTGGFIATMDFLKDKPDKQKKLIKAGIAAGLLDGGIDFENFELEVGFDFNPLLLASLGTALTFYGLRSSNDGLRSISSKVAMVMTKVAKGVEYASYGALSIEALDLLTGLDLGGVVGQVIDGIDVLDVVDGAEALEGFATLGIGIGLSRAVKKGMNHFNKESKEDLRKVYDKLAIRDVVRQMLKSNAPASLIVGPYTALR